jgi:hypothetical protein
MMQLSQLLSSFLGVVSIRRFVRPAGLLSASDDGWEDDVDGCELVVTQIRQGCEAGGRWR